MSPPEERAPRPAAALGQQDRARSLRAARPRWCSECRTSAGSCWRCRRHRSTGTIGGRGNRPDQGCRRDEAVGVAAVLDQDPQGRRRRGCRARVLRGRHGRSLGPASPRLTEIVPWLSALRPTLMFQSQDQLSPRLPGSTKAIPVGRGSTSQAWTESGASGIRARTWCITDETGRPPQSMSLTARPRKPMPRS